MNFAVTELRRAGVRLTRDEIAIAPTACGDLLIRNIHRGSSEGRPITQAQVLYTRATFPYSLLTPIFEPQLIRMQSGWFIINGWQIEADAGQNRVTHYRQEWLVRPSTVELEELQQQRISEKAARVKALGAAAMGND